MNRLLPVWVVGCVVVLSGAVGAFQARPGLFSTVQATSTAATAVTVAGGITAGSGAVGIVGTTGKIPGLSSTYFTSVDGSALTALAAAQVTGTLPNATQDAITRTGTVTSGTWSGAFGTPTGRIAAANLPLVLVASTSINTTTGSTGSIADATPTTIFSASSTGMYAVFAYVSGAGAANYTAQSFVMSEGSSARAVSNNGVSLTITVSGTNVQVTQTSGGSATVSWSYVKIL